MPVPGLCFIRSSGAPFKVMQVPLDAADLALQLHAIAKCHGGESVAPNRIG